MSIRFKSHSLPDEAIPARRSKKIDPAQYALSGSEDAQQIALFMWAQGAKTQYPELALLFAIPNGGFRTRSEAARFRAMGVKAGVPDTFLPVKRGQYSGLFIELKRPKKGDKQAGKASAEQKVWIEDLRKQGYAACVCVGYEAAKEMLIQYLEYKE